MKSQFLISLVLIALGAGLVAYARCAASFSDSVPAKVEQRLREKHRRERLIVIRMDIIRIIAFW